MNSPSQISDNFKANLTLQTVGVLPGDIPAAEPEDARGGLLSPMTEATRLCVAGIQLLIDNVTLRTAVAKQGGDMALYTDLKVNLECLYVALAEQEKVWLNWQDRAHAHKLGELMHSDILGDAFNAHARRADEEEAAADAAFAADEEAEARDERLAAYILSLEKRISSLERSPLPKKRICGRSSSPKKRGE